MKYIKNFNDHKVNEEFLSGVLDALKGLWSTATNEIKKMGQNPTMDQLQDWLEKNTFNKTSPNFLFKKEIDTFSKNTESNPEACLKLITDMLDMMGEDNMNEFYTSLLKVFGKNLAPIETIKYYFRTARANFIKDFKFLGVDANGKIDPTKINNDVNTDTSHLPELKKILKPIATDNKKCRDATLNWVNTVVIPRLLKYVQDIKPEDVEAYLKTKNIEAPKSAEELKVGDIVTWKSKQGEEVKKPIIKMEDDTLTFQDQEGKEFTKLKSEVVKVKEEAEQGKPEDITTKLKAIKDKPEDLKKVDSYLDFISKEENRDKIEEIEKIINPTQNT